MSSHTRGVTGAGGRPPRVLPGLRLNCHGVALRCDRGEHEDLAADLGVDEHDVRVLLRQLGELNPDLPDDLAEFLRRLLDPHVSEPHRPTCSGQEPRAAAPGVWARGLDPTASRTIGNLSLPSSISTRSSGRPRPRPERGPTSGADQRGRSPVGQRRFSLLGVIQRPSDGPAGPETAQPRVLAEGHQAFGS